MYFGIVEELEIISLSIDLKFWIYDFRLKSIEVFKTGGQKYVSVTFLSETVRVAHPTGELISYF